MSLQHMTPLLEFKLRCGKTDTTVSPICFRDRSLRELVLSSTLIRRQLLDLFTLLKLNLMFSAPRPLLIRKVTWLKEEGLNHSSGSQGIWEKLPYPATVAMSMFVRV